MNTNGVPLPQSLDLPLGLDEATLAASVACTVESDRSNQSDQLAASAARSAQPAGSAASSVLSCDTVEDLVWSINDENNDESLDLMEFHTGQALVSGHASNNSLSVGPPINYLTDEYDIVSEKGSKKAWESLSKSYVPALCSFLLTLLSEKGISRRRL